MLARAMEIFLYWFNPTHRDREGDLKLDLTRLKTFVESNALAQRPDVNRSNPT